MTPFLQQIASVFYQQYGEGIQQLTFVFPNRRSGLFFRKYLSQEASKPLFSPAILTINEVFLQLSEKQLADRMQMLFLLYQVYTRISQSKESFDDFVFWGEMILNDLDDVDKYLVDARQLFTNISDLKKIDSDFSYLEKNQIEAIRAFWSSFQPKTADPNQQFFQNVWKHLYPVYAEFRKLLTAEGLGYEGMIAREVIEKLKQDTLSSDLPYEKIIFIGLNAITTVEKELMLYFQNRGIADFYWDCSSDKLLDPDNKASFFITDHLKTFPSVLTIPKEAKTQPTFELLGIPSRIGQAKQVHALLEEVVKDQPELSPEEALRIAVILPDEQLLLPVLNSIPNTINRINVTLGYPLSGTLAASFVELIANLQKNIRVIDGQPNFYYRNVLPLLNHQYISTIAGDLAQAIIREIVEFNYIYVRSSTLARSGFLQLLFSTIPDSASISDYLIRILEKLSELLSGTKEEVIEPIEEQESTVGMHQLELDFIFQYFTVINRMKRLQDECRIEMSVETYFRLLKRMTETVTFPFQGEPLSGIQIMGVLETRVLDFDRLIILSMNEGVFPIKQAAGSFIPYNLRKGFGLPTVEHQDSVWSYHFYRLIARAKKVTFLYDTRTEGMQSGEVSRFIHQLKYHYETPVDEKLVVYNISSTQALPIQIQKSDEIMEKLALYRVNGGKALSASTINTYLDCPLKFYFQSIKGLEEEEEVFENVENRIFGNLLHKAVEILYKPFSNSLITADLLKLAAKEGRVTEAIERAYAEIFFHSDQVRRLSGQNYLTGEMIRKYILKIMERDRQLTPFRYIQSEIKINRALTLSSGMEIELKGFIDRLDEVNETIRIVDYKSGSQKATDFSSMNDFFDSENEKRPQAIMQVFTYAWMYHQQHSVKPIQPVIYYARELFSDGFNPSIYIGKDKELVDNFAMYTDEFEVALRTCLDHLFDPAIPFTQTTNHKVCVYCPFATICGTA